jgi:hypothetical protein
MGAWLRRIMRTSRITAPFALLFLIIALGSFGRSGSQDECSETAKMDIYSDAYYSNETGDVNGFELALDKPNTPHRKALLFVYEGAANNDGIPLPVTTDGNDLVIKGTWTEHLTEYPSKKEIVQTHFVTIKGVATPKMFRGTIAIEGLEIVKPERMLLKRARQIWLCSKRSSS